MCHVTSLSPLVKVTICVKDETKILIFIPGLELVNGLS
jgi:hypothetical protein